MRELGPLGLGHGERVLRLRGRDQPAQGPRDPARRVRAAAASRRRVSSSPARSRTRRTFRRPARSGGRSTARDCRTACCSPASSPTRLSPASTRARSPSCRRRWPRDSDSPPSRPRPPARLSCSATFRRIARRSDDAALYFPSGDARALAGQLEAVADDDALRDEYGAAARRRVAGLSWDASAAALHAVLREAARA